MATPVIEYRDPVTPSAVLSSLALTGSGTGGAVVSGSNSNPSNVRVYNNYAGTAAVPDALSCVLAAYDDPYTPNVAVTDPARETWLQVSVHDYCGSVTGADKDGMGNPLFYGIGGSVKHAVPVNGGVLMGSVADPTAPPTGSNANAATALAAGTYHVAYSYNTATGETNVSPAHTFTLSAGDAIFLSNLAALPSGVLSVTWYVSQAANSATLLRSVTIGSNTGPTITAYPSGPAAPVSSTANGSYITVAVRAAPPSGATVAGVMEGLWLEYSYV